mmetsp:Transcript_76424/g.153440  ORF Transcript_76424/g.153440 Transcript_76424/m.153440 type:complete len:249 (-) Transcript_76424:115-861(-)
MTLRARQTDIIEPRCAPCSRHFTTAAHPTSPIPFPLRSIWRSPVVVVRACLFFVVLTAVAAAAEAATRARASKETPLSPSPASARVIRPKDAHAPPHLVPSRRSSSTGFNRSWHGNFEASSAHMSTSKRAKQFRGLLWRLQISATRSRSRPDEASSAQQLASAVRCGVCDQKSPPPARWRQPRSFPSRNSRDCSASSSGNACRASRVFSAVTTAAGRRANRRAGRRDPATAGTVFSFKPESVVCRRTR